MFPGCLEELTNGNYDKIQNCAIVRNMSDYAASLHTEELHRSLNIFATGLALMLPRNPLLLTSTKTILPGLVNSLTFMHVLHREYTNIHIIHGTICGRYILSAQENLNSYVVVYCSTKVGIDPEVGWTAKVGLPPVLGMVALDVGPGLGRS